MPNAIRLRDFILNHTETILEAWEEFAKSITPPALTMSSELLRDHAGMLLQTIAHDLSTPQTDQQQAEKSKNKAIQKVVKTAAEEHAESRLLSGFTIEQLISEYRALRASVLHLWSKNSKNKLLTDIEDMTRFNEAIDQAIAESVARYSGLIKNSQNMFLAILGHDLRNPLATTIMASSLLMRSEDVGNKCVLAATRIFNSSQRMNKLIKDLIDYTRGQLGQKLPITKGVANLARICNDIIEEHRISHPDRIIRFKREGVSHGIWDENRIAQVISNLLGNAIQHGASAFPIEVYLKSTDHDVVVTINNKGKTIPTERLQHIFEPLFRHESEGTMEESSTSLGLGLHIAREIILSHGGNIHVLSSDEDGTSFVISLPRSNTIL